MYWLLKTYSGDENFFEHILLRSPRFYFQESLYPQSYGVRVSENLQGALSYMAREEATLFFPLHTMVRIYAAGQNNETFVMFVGQEVDKLGVWLEKEKKVQDSAMSLGISSDIPDMEWTILGITFPRWIVLFDEGVAMACRDELDDNIGAIYVPVPEDLLDEIKPEKGTEEVASFLMNAVFSSLPFRNLVDFISK